LKSNKNLNADVLFLIGASIVVLPWFMIDAMTVPKFTLVGIYAVYIIRMYSFKTVKFQIETGKSFSYIWAIISFALAVVLSFRPKNDFWTQQLFGAYGRNTGIILYLCLSIIGIRFAIERDKEFVESILNAFLFSAFCVNIYYILQYHGFDFATWEDTYGVPSSFLGNPNFVSSYAGLALSLSVIILFTIISNFFKSSKNASFSFGYLTFIVLVSLTSCVVLSTNGSAQGILVASVGPMVYYVTSLLVKVDWTRKGSIQVFSLLASTSVLYFVFFREYFSFVKLFESVIGRYDLQIRFSYWRTAFRIFKDHPFGVGLDSLGDYYFAYRDPQDIASSSFVNAAHNVPLDFLVGGGLFLFISYCSLLTVTFVRSVKSIVNRKGSNQIELLVFSCWIAVLMQSLVSINQISLALWNFVFMGLLLGLARDSTNSYSDEKYKRKKFQNLKKVSQPNSVKFGGILLGFPLLVMAILPLWSDYNFRESLYSQDLSNIEISSKAFPSNTSRLNFAAETLCINGDAEGAVRLTKHAVELNSRDLFSWRLLLTLPGERQMHVEALQRLGELDPRNAAWKSSQSELMGSRDC
jgi:hypothetical protein